MSKSTLPIASELLATCHCGGVTFSLAAPPAEVVACNCSLCRRYGVLWAYYSTADFLVVPDPAATDIYAWNGRHVDFHRCRHCGCVTHWSPRNKKRGKWGVNARLLLPEVLAAAKVRRRDGAATGKIVDWIFKDPMTTAAAIDRLVHHSVILEMTGKSIRIEDAQALQGGNLPTTTTTTTTPTPDTDTEKDPTTSTSPTSTTLNTRGAPTTTTPTLPTATTENT